MRILLVSDQHSSEGGAEAIVANLARGLDERGHDVRLCVARTDPSAPILPSRIGVDLVGMAAEGAAANSGARAAVAGVAEEFSPDVVHFHSIFDYGVLDELRARWPAVWTCHDHRAHCPNGDRVYPRSRAVCRLPMGTACIIKSLSQGCVAGPRPRTLRALALRERLWTSLRECDRVAAPSRCVADLLLANGLPEERLAVTPLFTPFADLSDAPPPPADPRMLFAARLVPQKGTADVVWTAERLRALNVSARVAIAGDGPDAALVVSAARAGAPIDYLGRLSSAAMAAAYEQSRFVLVTPRWIDPFPIVGLEALAFGRPVIAYRLGGISELISDRDTGLLVEPGDREALAGAARLLLADTGLAVDLGRRGRRLVRERYRPKHALAANEAMYEAAVHARGARVHAPNVEVAIFRADPKAPRWPQALETRVAVFVREQDVPLEAEIDWHDTADPTCAHAVAWTASGRAAAAGRIYDEDTSTARVGRMAVLPAFRGLGLGMKILDALLSEARERGRRYAVLDAQLHALAFYSRRGFVPEGSTFDDCGIPHQKMRAEL